jgi:hypothetical protein
MRNDKHLALKLRKKGKSYQEIQKELIIPKSTLHYWFKNLDWSQNIKQTLSEKALRLSSKRMRVIAKAQKKRWREWREQYRKDALNEFPHFKNNHLFIAGLMLYWGKGDSNLKNETRLTNINPKMIYLFYKFLLNICGIPKKDINISLFLYPDLSEIHCKNFWHKNTKIPLRQFDKVQFIHGKHPAKRLKNGICTIRVKRSRGLKEKIFIWIDLLSKEL